MGEGRGNTRGWIAAGVLAAGVGSAQGQGTMPGAGPMIPPPPPGGSGDLDLTQDAWIRGASREGQHSPGHRIYTHATGRVMNTYTRLGMVTMVMLERPERVVSVSVGDPNLVEVRVDANAANVLLIRPRQAGADTNVHVITASMRSYALYVATEDEGGTTTPDAVVQIRLPSAADRIRSGRGGQPVDAPGGAGHDGQGESGVGAPGQAQQQWHVDVSAAERRDRTVLAARAQGDPIVDPELLKEYGNLKVETFQIGRMRFDLEMFASSEHAIREIAPKRVMRDDVWTWLDYEGKPEARWPSVNAVTDGTESPVAFHSEANGRMLVVHAVGDLVLRNGPHVICIRRKRPVAYAGTGDVTVDARLTGVYGENDPTGDTYTGAGAKMGWVDRVRVELGPGEAGEAKIRSVLARARLVHEGEYPNVTGVANEDAQKLCAAVGAAGGECVIVRTAGR